MLSSVSKSAIFASKMFFSEKLKQIKNTFNQSREHKNLNSCSPPPYLFSKHYVNTMMIHNYYYSYSINFYVLDQRYCQVQLCTTHILVFVLKLNRKIGNDMHQSLYSVRQRHIFNTNKQQTCLSVKSNAMDISYLLNLVKQLWVINSFSNSLI